VEGGLGPQNALIGQTHLDWPFTFTSALLVLALLQRQGSCKWPLTSWDAVKLLLQLAEKVSQFTKNSPLSQNAVLPRNDPGSYMLSLKKLVVDMNPPTINIDTCFL